MDALNEMLSNRGKRAGDKRVFGKPSDCVCVRIDTNGVQGHYGVLRLEWVRKSTSTVNFTIDLTSEDLRGSSKVGNSALKEGGYWWTYTSDWYNWKPDAALVWKRVLEVLKVCGIKGGSK